MHKLENTLGKRTKSINEKINKSSYIELLSSMLVEQKFKEKKGVGLIEIPLNGTPHAPASKALLTC